MGFGLTLDFFTTVLSFASVAVAAWAAWSSAAAAKASHHSVELQREQFIASQTAKLVLQSIESVYPKGPETSLECIQFRLMNASAVPATGVSIAITSSRGVSHPMIHPVPVFVPTAHEDFLFPISGMVDSQEYGRLKIVVEYFDYQKHIQVYDIYFASDGPIRKMQDGAVLHLGDVLVASLDGEITKAIAWSNDVPDRLKFLERRMK